MTKINQNIGHQTLLLDGKEVDIPIAHFPSDSSKHITITAGMDGDEYTGIEAAYKLIAYFEKHPPKDAITVLPIVNIPGFYNITSQNPLDNKYPKNIFPGKKNGSPSEQIIFWLYDNFLQSSTIWIDLHSGSLTEHLTPFILTRATKNGGVNSRVLHTLSQFPKDLTIFHKENSKKTDLLAKNNGLYFLLESGELGQVKEKNITQLIQWTRVIVNSVEESTYRSTFASYTKVHEYIALKNGLCRPLSHTGEKVKKGEALMEVLSLTGNIIQTIRSGVDGIILWEKSVSACQKNDTLVGVASSEKLFKV